MSDSINIRPEQEKDAGRISQIIEAAFKNHLYGNQKEHLLVSELRASHAQSLSLVAEVNERVAGHIAFSEI